MNSNNLVFVYEIGKDSWRKVKPNIDVPRVDSHSAVVIDNKMYVYGGYIPEKASYLIDMYAFNLDLKTWEIIYKGQNTQN